MDGFKLIPNWINQDLRCFYCGKTRSVKYKTNVVIIDTLPSNEEIVKEVCICNKCVLKFIAI